MVVRLDSLPDTIKLLARMLRILLPWCSEEKPDTEIFERHGFELRADRELSILIDAGLSCPDPSIRKESMYVVKQTVRFGALYMQPGNLKSIVNLEDHPFLWAPSERVAMARDWRAFCLLYEAVSSTETHFVEPALPMIRSIMADDSLLPCRWWSLLVRRAQMNDSINIRILFIRAILQLPVGELKRLQLATRSFVYETLIPALDNGQLYAQSPARSDGAYEVSEFGMCVACFLSATLLTGAPANFGADATRLLKCISEDIRSPTAILFMLQSFVLLPRTRLLKESDGFISYMRRIATNPVLGSHKARRLARWQLLQAFLQLVDPNNISFDQLATLLTDLITEKGPDKVSLKLDCIEYVAVRNWLIASYGAMYVPQKVSSAIETFLICPDSSENNPIESSRGTTSESQNNCMEQIDSQNLKNISRNNSSDSDNLNCPESIATMLIFSLEENNSDGFSASIKPLLDKMDELTAANCGKNPERVFVLFHALDDAVRAATGNKQDLLTSTNVQAKVYEWLAIIVSLLLPSKEGSVSMGGVNDSEAKEKSHQDLNSTNLSGSNNSNTQTYKTEFLNDGFKHLIGTLRLLLERASTQPEALVAYLDIVLYKVVALVAKFDEQRVNEVAESIDAQVQKTAALELMDAALHALDEANTHHLGFLLDGTVDHVFSMTLMKPPGLTDTQMLGWRDLQTTFTTSKWSLIGTLAHFSTRCMELQGKVQLDKIFLECLNNLEDAKYRSVLSIYSCMQVLVSIDPKSDHELLNKVDDSTTDVPANNNQISELTSGQSNVNGNDDIKNSDTNFILRKKNEPKNNDIGLELVKKAFEVSKNVIGEVSDSPAWHYLYMQSFIDFMFQPQTVLMRPDLEAVIKDSIDWIMTIGGRRQNIVTRLANNLQVSWSSTNYPSGKLKFL